MSPTFRHVEKSTFLGLIEKCSDSKVEKMRKESLLIGGKEVECTFTRMSLLDIV